MASATDTGSPERQKPERGRRPRSRFRGLPGSRLGRLILALNLLGLAILVVGALVLNEVRQGLINARIDSLSTQGELIASILNQAA
ncbi:MAG TPA: sensor N-terminal transmembrane domain-containing protein, partial [Phenylobacterium sp.]|nr:sensor N-terminal transmembrane domain-containing protein [Phenylobacterium sp.]